MRKRCGITEWGRADGVLARARTLLALVDAPGDLGPRLASWDELVQIDGLPEEDERLRREATARVLLALAEAGPTLGGGVVYSLDADGKVRRALPT